MTKNIGQWAEQLALGYLIQQGLMPINQNFHSRFGEIDLIMLDGDCLCFIEVKARKHQSLVSAVETVDVRKQQKTILTAQHFLQKYLQWQDYDCRFDVIAIQYAQIVNISSYETFYLQQHNIDLQWLKHAYMS